MKFLHFFLLPYRQSRGYLCLDIGKLLFDGLNVWVNIYLIAGLIDAVSVSNFQGTLFYAFLYILYIVCAGLYEQVERFLRLKAASTVSQYVQKSFVKRLMGLSYANFENSQMLDQISLVQTEFIDEFIPLHKGTYSAFRTLFKVASLLLVFCFALGYMALVFALLLLLVVAIIRYNAQKTLETNQQQATLKRELEDLVEVNTSPDYTEERHIFAYSLAISKKYRDKHKKYIRVKQKTMRKNLWRLESSDLPILFMYLFIFVSLLMALKKGAITQGYFVSIFTQMIAFLEIIRYELSDSFEQLITAAGYYKSYVQLGGEKVLEEAPRGAEKSFATEEPAIEFIDVSFHYPNSPRLVLEHLSFALAQAECCMLVGENGSGKSTVMKLILGLFSDYTGCIRLGGQDIRTLSPQQHWAIVAPMFQDYARYYLSLAANVRLGNPSESLQSTLLAKYSLSELPQDVILRKINDESLELSGGQWQRIALARLEHMARAICVLDEPTSAIDPAEEFRIYSELASLLNQSSALIISHRLGLAKAVDRILVLEGGKITQDGTHYDLVETAGKYKQMFESQRSLYYAKD